DIDPYQQRYLAHQARKRRTLIEVMRDRHSDRMYDDRPVPDDVREQLLEVVELAPSSCDRRGVAVRVVDTRDELALLGGLLVGGAAWAARGRGRGGRGGGGGPGGRRRRPRPACGAGRHRPGSPARSPTRPPGAQPTGPHPGRPGGPPEPETRRSAPTRQER